MAILFFNFSSRYCVFVSIHKNDDAEIFESRARSSIVNFSIKCQCLEGGPGTLAAISVQHIHARRAASSGVMVSMLHSPGCLC
jgi:hypothetical protein